MFLYGSDPNYFDSDNDGLPDGFEVRAGLNPATGYSRARRLTRLDLSGQSVVWDVIDQGPYDADADSDFDGLSNVEELYEGTDPLDGDSDGDGVGDGVEYDQASDPNDGSDGGIAPPPEEVCTVRICLGPVDPQDDKLCERYSMNVGGHGIRNNGGRSSVCREVRVRRGECLPITMGHLGRRSECAVHYNYHASVEVVGECCSIIDDPQQLLGSWGSGGMSTDRTVGRTAQVCLPIVDIRVDSNNNNGFDISTDAHLESMIEDVGMEAFPGKVILCNTLDDDRDGIPGYADGINHFGTALDADDESPNSRFVPVVVEVSGFPDMESVMVTLGYPASDPNAIGTSETQPFTLPSGKLRLWKLDGSSPRDPRPVLQGGRYIAPGTYTAAQLDISTGSPVAVLYAEVVAPSSSIGDIRIVLSTSTCGDAARVSAARVRVLARAAQETTYFETGGFITSILEDPNDPLAPLPTGLSFGPCQLYKLQVSDPRRQGIVQATVGGVVLPLTLTDDLYETPEFICLQPEPPAAWPTPSLPVITVSSASLECQYNPSVAPPAAKSKPHTPEDTLMAKHIREIVDGMETDGWNGTTSIDGTTYTGNDDGAFGKEVHKRVSLRLNGHARWLTDVVVENGTNRIVRIGGVEGPAGTTQIDVLRLKAGYSPQVGDVLDANQIDDLYEVKTSVGGKITPTQKTRLKATVGGRQIKVCMSERRWTSALGFHPTPRCLQLIKLVSVLGAATAAYALISRDDYDDELDNVARLMNEAKAETDPVDKKLKGMEALGALKTYLGHFTPDDTALDVVMLTMAYKILANW